MASVSRDFLRYLIAIVALSLQAADTPKQDQPQSEAKNGKISTPAQAGAQPSQGSAVGTLTLRLEEVPGNQRSNFADVLKIVSELVGAIAWPGLLVVLLLSQRRELSRLFAALVGLVNKSTRLKIGEVINLGG